MFVEYVIDKDFDSFVVWSMLSSNDPAGNANRVSAMGIPQEIFKKISESAEYDRVSADINNFMSDLYEQNRAEFSRALHGYQLEWDKINDRFVKSIEEKLQYKFFFEKYMVVLSPVHKGVTSRGGDKVIRSIFESPADQLRVTAHEILMAHLWNVIFEEFPESEDDDPLMHYWAINEISTVCVLGLDSNLNSLWTEKTRGFDIFLKNYPQLDKLKTDLKGLYLKSADFLVFLNEAKEHLTNNYKNRNLLKE